MIDKQQDNDDQGQPSSFVRPFLVTAGRTKSKVDGLRLETLVERTDVETESLKFEAAAVHELCSSASAIAELSARLHLPTATIKVIVGDLIGSGHLQQHKTIGGSTDGGQNDIELVSRLIEGVRRL